MINEKLTGISIGLLLIRSLVVQICSKKKRNNEKKSIQSDAPIQQIRCILETSSTLSSNRNFRPDFI